MTIKRQPQFFFLIVVIIQVSLFVPSVLAQRVTSPSVRAAARLKNHPPRNWIRHYLGDDRYKIAGGVWKVVSTELDHFYYPAWAPEMLRQRPGIVIGFPSAEAAEDAGYRPSAYPSNVPLYNLSREEITAARQRDTVNRTGRSIRITLADGKSTVLLPSNWRRTRTGIDTILGYATQSDTLQSLSGGGTLRFAFINSPINTNIEPFLTPQRFPQAVQLAVKSGKVNSQVTQVLQQSNLSAVKLGGLSGIIVTPKTASAILPGPLRIVARGSKAYLLEVNGKVANASEIINSFQPR